MYTAVHFVWQQKRKYVQSFIFIGNTKTVQRSMKKSNVPRVHSSMLYQQCCTACIEFVSIVTVSYCL